MKAVLVAVCAFPLLVVAPAHAQTSSPASDKPETGCTASAAAGSGQTTGSSANSEADSEAVEKNAILPSAGQHANSAAPTVQRNGRPMQVRPDCPPEESR